MIIFPIGMAKGLPVIPLVILGLVAGNIYLSAREISRLSHQERSVVEPFRVPMLESRLALVNELCLLKMENAGTCNEYTLTHLKALSQERIYGQRTSTSSETFTRLANLYRTGPPLLPGPYPPITASVRNTIERVLRSPRRVIDPNIKHLPSYVRLTRQMDDLKSSYFQDAKRLGLLNFKNVNVYTLTRAQFQHLNWAHLLGNLFFLALFGVFVEARMGTPAMVITYFAAGYAGLIAELAFHDLDGIWLMGASANVMGIIGCFAVLFGHHRMRIWLSYFFAVNRIFYVPILWVAVPAAVALDLLGTLAGPAGAAHVSHLAGLSVGALCGWLYGLLSPLPRDVLYEQEWELMAELKRADNWQEAEPLCQKLLSWNPHNIVAMYEGLRHGLHNDATIQSGGLEFAKTNLSACLAILSREKRWGESLKVLGTVPSWFGFSKFLSRWSPNSGLALAKHALDSGDWKSALRLYDWTWEKQNDQRTRTTIEDRLTQMSAQLMVTEPAFEEMVGTIGLSPQSRAILVRKPFR